MDFLELVNQYELSITDKKQIAEEIRRTFLNPDSPSRLTTGSFRSKYKLSQGRYTQILNPT